MTLSLAISLAILFYATIGLAVVEILLLCDPGSDAAFKRYVIKGCLLSALVIIGWPIVLCIIWRRRTWRQ